MCACVLQWKQVWQKENKGVSTVTSSLKEPLHPVFHRERKWGEKKIPDCVCMCMCVCLCVIVWKGPDGRVGQWGGGTGGRMWEGQGAGGRLMGGAKTVLTCAPLVHDQCNCSLDFLLWTEVGYYPTIFALETWKKRYSEFKKKNLQKYRRFVLFTIIRRSLQGLNNTNTPSTKFEGHPTSECFQKLIIFNLSRQEWVCLNP